MKLPKLLIAALLLLASPNTAFANFTVKPAVIRIEERDGRFETEFQITNVRGAPLALEIEVEERVFGITGGEERVDAEDDFLIFPIQMIIDPRDTQTVRVSYLGDIADTSRSFRLHVTEVLAPLSEDETDSLTVRTNFRFSPALHVIPEGSEADLRVEAMTSETGQDGKTELVLAVRNDGTRFAYLSEKQIEIGGMTITSEELTKAMEPRPVGPGVVMTLRVPREDAVSLVGKKALVVDKN